MANVEGPMSGFRDFSPEQMIGRGKVLDTIQRIYTNYGFVTIKTPAMERLKTLTGKYGEEADKLVYLVKGSQSRDFEYGLRYDMTVPLARYIAQRPDVRHLKRQVVGEVWRAERAQAGRFREFTQFDADTVGAKGVMADAEIVAMMSDAMVALEAPALIRVNNRRILDGLAETVGLDAIQTVGLTRIIDDFDKTGLENVVERVKEAYGDQAAKIVARYLSVKGTSEERLAAISQLVGHTVAGQEGVENIQGVFSLVRAAGYPEDSVTFDATIARGLDYYTGIIYETSLKGDAVKDLGSVCSGGRYDRLIAQLGGPDLPAIGTSIGVDRLLVGLDRLGKLPHAKTSTRVLVTQFDPAIAPEYLALAQELRHSGVPTEVYLKEGDKVGKQMKFGGDQGIPYAVVIGPDELSNGSVTVRNLNTRQEEQVPRSEVVEYLRRLQG